MRGIWVVTGVASVMGCSSPASRAAGQEAVDTEASSPPALAEPAAAGNHPTVLFRCEGGRVGAYLVPGSVDTLPSDDELVPISLDSAPEC